MAQCHHCESSLRGDGTCEVHGAAATVVAAGGGMHGTLIEPSAGGTATSDEPDALAAGSTVESYVVEGKIGAGGMGEVYAASHPVIGKRAAIKAIKREHCVRPNAVARFVREARAVNQIGHPNIVDVFDIGALPDGRAYLIMELLDGESVRDRVAREAPLSVDAAGKILIPVCRALEAAHGAGIVHRDLKPDNVFLVAVPGENDLVKLLDFGIAKLEEPSELVDSTESGVLLGTPAYISPEQAKGPDVGPPTDVYALGVMAYEMLVGERPFVADSPAEMIAKHLTEPPRPPRSLRPGLPASVAALLLAMLRKDPEQRPTVAEVREYFSSERPRPAAAEPASRRSWYALAAVVGVAAAVALVIALRSGATDTAPASPPAAAPETPPPATVKSPTPAAAAPRADVAGEAVAADPADASPPARKPKTTRRRRKRTPRPEPERDPAPKPLPPIEDDDATIDPFAAP